MKNIPNTAKPRIASILALRCVDMMVALAGSVAPEGGVDHSSIGWLADTLAEFLSLVGMFDFLS
ncbi:hypothetical protein GCM10025855_07560 [Shewanella glacialipiscicola]|uniref:Uncharacterized protein n=1 Tax=Shewanella glacialipiscicola TaxID=614069 RepID=A0ABQ6IZB2_9GAMM|nr:hypothetical protein GCM10025855_07560 [Shewanella glacialipiscicola]